MAAASRSEGARAVLDLYRGILRTHRQKLAPVMRELGDRVAREEFRGITAFHRAGKATEQHWGEFLSQWRLYLASLQGQARGQRGPAPCRRRLGRGRTVMRQRGSCSGAPACCPAPRAP